VVVARVGSRKSSATAVSKEQRRLCADGDVCRQGAKKIKKVLAERHPNCTVSPPFDPRPLRILREDSVSKKAKGSLPARLSEVLKKSSGFRLT
jgi:hypothetical protein